MNARHLQNIEAGRENLTLETLQKIGLKFRIDAAELLAEPASRKPRRPGRPSRPRTTSKKTVAKKSS